MKESDILYQNGRYWIAKSKPSGDYVVYRDGITHAEAFSTFIGNSDGLSLAKAYCDYRIKRETRLKELNRPSGALTSVSNAKERHDDHG